MENYSLQANEVLLYKGEAYNGLEIMLTNLNLIIVKKTTLTMIIIISSIFNCITYLGGLL